MKEHNVSVLQETTSKTSLVFDIKRAVNKSKTAVDAGVTVMFPPADQGSVPGVQPVPDGDLSPAPCRA